MAVKVVGRSNRNTKKNIANSDLIIKSTNYNRTNYLPSVPGPVATDSNFKDTVLLIHADGTSGANNTVVLDSSASNNTITIGGGNPAQGTFNSFNNNGWSMYFPGTASNYINMAADGNNTIGTGDFTMEFWFNSPNTTAGTSMIVSHQTGGMFSIGTSSGGVLSAVFNQDGGASDTKVGPSTSFKLGNNIWYHIAITRVGTLLTIYVNGTAAGTYTLGANTNIGSFGGAKPFYIGGGADLLSWYTGFLYDFRYVKGTALYTGNFSPPTSRLSTNVSGIRFLICDAENPSTTNRLNNGVTDVSGTYTGAITVNGSVPVVYNSPFTRSGNLATTAIGGSIFFNGTSNYLRLPNTILSNLTSTSDFTIEFWVYFNTVTAGVHLFDTGDGSGVHIVCGLNGSSIFEFYTNGATRINTGITAVAGAWYHLAYVRSSGITRVYVNGISQGGTYADTNSYVVASGYPNIGYKPAATQYFSGYISNFKFTPGKATYTSNFLIPTSPATSSDAPILLLNATNTGIIDQTGKNNLYTFGTAALSSTQSKFGGTSMYFDGTSDCFVATPSTSIAILTSGAFTIEAWVYNQLGSAATGVIVAQDDIVSVNGAVNLRIISTKLALRYYNTTPAQVTITSTNIVPTDTWTHVAATWSGPNTPVRLFINGNLDTTSSNITAMNVPTSYITAVGSNSGGVGSGSSLFIGYIDEVRLTKGVARYTESFTPPTTAFPDQ
jgi:hypothetical protein